MMEGCNISTFTSFFGATPNIFFGNVGRCLEVDFPNKPEPICFEDFNNLIEPVEETKTEVEKKTKFKKSIHLNQKIFQTRKQKLVFTFNHHLNLVDKNIISSSQVEEIIKKFLKELKELQTTYLHQRNVIFRHHMIETQGYYDENDDLYENVLEISKAVFDL